MSNGSRTNFCYLSNDVICILKPVVSKINCPVSSLYPTFPYTSLLLSLFNCSTSFSVPDVLHYNMINSTSIHCAFMLYNIRVKSDECLIADIWSKKIRKRAHLIRELGGNKQDQSFILLRVDKIT